MTAGNHAVVLVPSTNHAVRLEQILRRESIPCKMIPVPRQISSDCGVCIRVSRRDVELVRELVESTSTLVEGFVNL